jgi:ATP-binding cassette, subfamily C, bacterial CydC
MRALWAILRMMIAGERVALLRAGALSVLVLLMGAALLGVSGWFITAAAAAGLAGAGAVFDVFRPSAMVRFLALGRTAARYGERLLSHDAVLRVLARLRVQILTGLAAVPYARLQRLRGSQALSRITADVEALDGVVLRLALPVVAGAAAQGVGFAALWALVGLPIAGWVCGGFVLGGALVLWRAGLAARLPSRRAEAAAQAFRARLIDLLRAREDLAVYGQTGAQVARVMDAEARRAEARAVQEAVERHAGMALSLLGAGIAAGALLLGMQAAGAGQLSPAWAATGFFVALALAETVAPLRRAVGDLGRMIGAAERVGRGLTTPLPCTGASATGAELRFEAVGFARSGAALLVGFDLWIAAGETVALVGPSGVGKSTVLALAAGLDRPSAGRVSLGGLEVAQWDEAALRGQLGFVVQRPALMAGSIAESLQLGALEASEAECWAALQACDLAEVIRAKGGLAALIGARGAGLSGGEARRLALARALLMRPAVLLLDEPTEGLDADAALRVLAGIRAFLPQAAVLIAAHRALEIDWADRSIALHKVACLTQVIASPEDGA